MGGHVRHRSRNGGSDTSAASDTGGTAVRADTAVRQSSAKAGALVRGIFKAKLTPNLSRTGPLESQEADNLGHFYL